MVRQSYLLGFFWCFCMLQAGFCLQCLPMIDPCDWLELYEACIFYWKYRLRLVWCFCMMQAGFCLQCLPLMSPCDWLELYEACIFYWKYRSGWHQFVIYMLKFDHPVAQKEEEGNNSVLSLKIKKLDCSPVISRVFGSRWCYGVINETVLYGIFRYTIFPIL